MNVEKFTRYCLIFYATILFIASILHGLPWIKYFPTYPELKGLTDLQLNTFYLFNLSVSLLLFFISILSYTISFIKSFSLNQLRIIILLMIILWVLRLVLEIIYPVKIPFVIIKNPTSLLKSLIVFAIIVLCLPEILYRIKKK